MMNETIEKYKKHNSTKEFQKDLDRIIHAMQEMDFQSKKTQRNLINRQ